MLNIKKLLENDTDYIGGILKKGGTEAQIQSVIESYQQQISLSKTLDEKRNEQNTLAKSLPSLSADEKPVALATMKECKAFIKENESKEKELKSETRRLLCTLPNPAHSSVSPGESDDENTAIRFSGEKPTFNFTPKAHWDLGADLDLIDSERGAKVSGARFHFLKNELVTLQFALVQYALGIAQKHGFSLLLPPQLVNRETAFGTGYLDAGHEEQTYIVNPGDDDLFLIGTSEVPNTAYYRDELIPESELPIRIAAYSSCFRKEAGAAGKDGRGILRCHQFDKVEMGVFCLPENSYDEHDLILAVEEEIYQGLGIHYQVVDICSGDLGGSAAKKWDLEAWMPGQDAYREITSTSNCTDFQARRLNIRVKRENGKNEILHTLNGTGIAVGRTLIALMEQFQTEEGEIIIPEVLRKWTGIDKISKKK